MDGSSVWTQALRETPRWVATLTTGNGRSVLISGASITGPTIAYWLRRYGFRVTIVERASGFRGGGYPIDIRGTALQVTDLMGITPQLRAAHVDTRAISFYVEDGRRVKTIQPEAISGGVAGRDIEVSRGVLASQLAGLLSDDVEIIFNDSITTLEQHPHQVDVALASGAHRRFDLVIGADGLHSNVRRLTFGPEEQFHRYLGYCFAGFTVPNYWGLAHEAVFWNAPGRAAALLGAGAADTLHGFLLFSRSELPLRDWADPAGQRAMVASQFSGDGWEIPTIVDAMMSADDLFFDVVSQIRMPAWSTGRVVLAGDAAHAPSFMSGQGSSIALVGGYLLAREIATHSDHSQAFATYEQRARGFVERNQALADGGRRSLAPQTRHQLWLRNQALRLIPVMSRTGIAGREARKANTALQIPLPSN